MRSTLLLGLALLCAGLSPTLLHADLLLTTPCPDDAAPYCLSSETVQLDQNVCLLARATNYDGVVGFQMALQFDTEALQFTDFNRVGPLANAESQFFNTDLAAEGVVTVAYVDPQGAAATYEDDTPLFEICFMARAPGTHIIAVTDTLVGETLVVYADDSTAPFSGNFGEVTVLACQDTSVEIARSICEGEVIEFGGSELSEAGVYLDTVVTAAGCDSITLLELTVNTVDFTPQGGAVCAGESFTLTAPEGFGLALVGDEPAALLTLTAGDYQVTVADLNNGCTKTVPVTVEALANPDAAITGETSYCANEAGAVLTATGGVSYSWSTGATTATVTVPAGTYAVTVTDDNGCTDVAATSVTVAAAPTAAIFGETVYCAQEEGATLTAVGGTTYRWSNDAETATITVPAGTYTVTVTNAAGCEDTATQTVDLETTPPEFLTCPEDQEVSINFGDESTVVTWNEPFVEDDCGPEGLTVSSTLASGATVGLGTTEVTYTATDAAGNTATCTFTITAVASDELTFYVDSAGTTVDGDLFCIPVRVRNFNAVAAFSVAFGLPAFAGTEFLTVELSPELTALSDDEGAFGTGNLPDGRTSVVFVTETGDGESLVDGSLAFTFKIRIPGGSGDCFRVDPVFDFVQVAAFREGPGEVVPTLLGGEACYPTEVDIRGRIYVCNAEQRFVAAADVLLSDDENDSDFDITDVPGRYDFLERPFGRTYTITPERDFDHLIEQVNIFDLLALVRHIRGRELILDPCAQIAADANRSNTISATDIPDIQELIVGNLSEFPNNTSWRFVPASYVFTGPALLSPFPEAAVLENLAVDTVVDFRAIKIGDITGDAVGQFTGEDPPAVSVVARPAPAREGERLTVPVYPGSVRVLGLQQRLRFDATRLRLESVRPGGGDVAFAVNTDAASKGLVTISWLDLDPDRPATGAPLYELTFTALADVTVGEGQLWSDPAYRNLAGGVGGTQYAGLDLTFARPAAAPLRWSVSPNPAADFTTVTLGGGSGTHYRTQLMDLNGRVLSERRGTLGHTGARHRFGLTELPPGTYLLRLTTAAGRAEVKKIVRH